MNFLLHPVSLFLVALLGMFLNFLNTKVRGESWLAIKDYFKDHFRSTLVSFGATVLGYAVYMLALQSGQAADFMAVIGIGYMCDAFFNKWEVKKDETGT